MKRFQIFLLGAAMLVLGACAGNTADKPLMRGKASSALDEAFASYLKAVEDCKEDLHSIMVLQHDKVLEEHFFTPADSAHILNSVSKTFTSAAVGFAISEGLLSLDEKIVDIFPELVTENVSDTMKRVTVRNLLTMNSGHGTEPASVRRSSNWVQAFLEAAPEYEPGTCYCYNSYGTYVLSAAVQKRSGQKIVDYLDTRLWQPLGIDKPVWQESPQGVNFGGWGLYLKTEDLARMGLCIINGGKFDGKQVIPADWVAEMGKNHVPSVNAGINLHQARERGMDPTENDWMQGYGYQMWRCRHNGYRADGANGQYIIILPDQDAVIVTTANIRDMAEELNLIWDHILPAL